MAALNARQRIREAEEALEEAKENYLRKFGWATSSSNPGALWLWQRDFSDIDAERLEWWQVRCAEKALFGQPSKPVPYGLVKVPLAVAVHMTMSELDNEIDQDGDPDTPAITAESLEDDGELRMVEEDAE